MHLHLNVDAVRLLDKYCGPRGRGQFISQLIVDHDRRQKDGDGVIAAPREKASSAAQEEPAQTRRRKRRF
jgi:hypothetical protein